MTGQCYDDGNESQTDSIIIIMTVIIADCYDTLGWYLESPQVQWQMKILTLWLFSQPPRFNPETFSHTCIYGTPLKITCVTWLSLKFAD